MRKAPSPSEGNCKTEATSKCYAVTIFLFSSAVNTQTASSLGHSLPPAEHLCSGALLSAASPPYYNQLPRSAKSIRGTGGHNHAISLSSGKCNLNDRAGGSIPKTEKLKESAFPFSSDSWGYTSRSVFPLSVPAHTPVLRGSKIHHAFLRQGSC